MPEHIDAGYESAACEAILARNRIIVHSILGIRGRIHCDESKQFAHTDRLTFMTSRIALALTLTATMAHAQRTQKEIIKATTPELDAKLNSNEVPDVVAVSGKIDRVVVLRFKYMADLLSGIEKAVKDQKIQNAVILSGVGSVRNYQVHSVSNRTFPSKNTFTKDVTTPADIVSMNGYVLNGKVHAHMTMTDANKAFGGHLEPETNVFTFAIVTLGVLSDGMDLGRADDKTWR